MNQAQAPSPRGVARFSGLLYLIIIVAAPFAEMYVLSKVIVPGDAAATAANILESEPLFRLGGAASLLTVFCDIALAAIFYELLKHVNRGLALMAAFFRLAAIMIVAVNALTYFAPLALLRGSTHALTLDQVQALSILSLRLHTTGYNIALLVFGGHCLLLGYLVARSTFLPRAIGLLLVLAGVCYLTNGFGLFAFPAFASRLVPYVLLPPAVAEVSLALWLLVVGLNTEKWRECAKAGATPA